MSNTLAFFPNHHTHLQPQCSYKAPKVCQKKSANTLVRQHSTILNGNVVQLEFSDAERDALARFFRSAIDTDRYPLSPRLAPLKAVLAKLAPSGQSVGKADKLDPKPQA